MAAAAVASEDAEAASVRVRAGTAVAEPPGTMGSGWGPAITITQDAQRFTVEYVFFGRYDMQPPMRFAYALDGSETTASLMMGRGRQVQHLRAAWNGRRLVLTTVHDFPNPETGQPAAAKVTRTLTLESTTSLVVDTVIDGVLGGPPTTTRTTYRKLPGGT